MNLILSAPFIIICFFTTAISHQEYDHLAGDISINCGSTEDFAALDGREWIGDKHEKISSSIQIKGSSTSSNIAGGSIVSADQAQYKTARISRSRFSYAFHLHPGPKLIRLHFNPALYRGFKGFKDLFTVEAGPFTLLGNFSASLTAEGDGKSFVKEFSMNVEENQRWFHMVFYPDQSIQPQDVTYAFINGIEIISIPTHLSYFRGEIEVVDLKSLVHIYNHYHAALEIIHRQNVKPSDDFANMFRVRTAVPERKINRLNNMTWKIAVDVGFRYLVRIHYCELGLKNAKEAMKKNAKEAQVIFKILISEIRVDYDAQYIEKMEDNEFLQYRDYMTTVQGRKQDGKHNLLISIQSTDELMDRNGPFKGFEILKFSNLDNSLAGPNPQPPAQDSPYIPIIQKLLKVCGDRNIIATASVTIITLVNVVVYKLQQLWDDNFTEEEKKQPARARRLCRRFSLAEIEAATQNFNHTFIIGNGGFGKVYMGIINNGQETVAIKRLKYSSNQGAREFWMEIETLSELRHVNLVSLIGYCNEQQEMILVYEYMVQGTLGDHLHRLATNNNHLSSLSWNQCLNICIGAGRGLDYLHTGHGLIHRDVKTSNILLDENFIAKVSDFGLAKPENIHESQSHDSTNVKGTYGYLDPYYIRTHKPTRKSDIYAFGVVLLEVLCGRPALDPRLEEDQRSLTTWAQENISKGNIEKILSSNNRGNIVPDSLKAFVRVAVSCLEDEPKNRPTMGQVVLQLEFALNLQEKPNSLVSNETGTAYDSPWDAVLKAAKPSNKKDLKGSTSDIKMSKFDWETIQAATDGFPDSRIIGKARGGTFYKAVLHTRQVVAVKRVYRSFSNYYLWVREIYYLSKYKHPNIMKLLGSFMHGEERIPVYEFMENTSLNAILFERSDQLPWAVRFKLIIGIARGVHYLHQSQDLRTIFSNIDPCNIFLDNDMTPKIAINYCDTKTNTEISTRDYTPPEGCQADHIYASDIYSFGVIVLEILSGRKHNSTSELHRDLITFVWKLWDYGTALDMLHTSIGIEFSSEEAITCIGIALLCTQFLPKHRPDSSVVVGALQLDGYQELEEELRKARKRRNSRRLVEP